MEATARPAWVTVDLGAIEANVAALAALAPSARMLVAVKADAYGHGAVPVGRAALAGGATHLGVSSVDEGAELRAAGIGAPIMVFSEPPPEVAAEVVARRLSPFVYSPTGIAALADAAAAAGVRLPVHLKVDTGMNRVGCRPADALGLVQMIGDRPELELEGIATHLASADLEDSSVSLAQLDVFDAVLTDVTARLGFRPVTHAANSAGLVGFPRSHYDLVRIGISIYGIHSGPGSAERVTLVPALSVRAHVSFVKDLRAGEAVSYGGRYVLERPGRVATVPVGYADGVPRNYGLVGGEALIGGRRHPVVGIVTMDQLMIDVGGAEVHAGDEVVLLGRQGSVEIDAHEWADRLGTITNEVVTRIGHRLPRYYVGGRSPR